MRQWKLALLILSGCLAAATGESSAADEAPVSAAEVRALIQRLEQAESKINRLESELAETRPYQPRPFPGPATALFEEPADAPLLLLDDEVQTILKQQQALQASHEELAARYDGLAREYESLSESQKVLKSDHDELLEDYNSGDGFVLMGSGATMRLTGRTQLDYWGFPYDDAGAQVLEGSPTAPVDPQDRFGLRRLRFGPRGEVGDNGIYRFDIEFSDLQSIQIRDAWVGMQNLPFLHELVIGNQKRPYGLDAINSTNYTIFLERPSVVDAFNTDYRRLGVQSLGFSDDLRWNWRYGLFNGVNIQGIGGYAGNAYQMEFAGRLANTWWYDEIANGRGYGHNAVAFTIAHPDGDASNNSARFTSRTETRTTQRWLDTGLIAGANWYELIGTEHVLNFGPLQLVGEVQNVFVQRESDANLHFWGAYAYAAYFLTGEHMPWDRESGQLDRIHPFENFFLVNRLCGGTGGGWGAWQVAARYSYLDISNRDILGGVANQGSLALVWYWSSHSRVQFDFEQGWIVDQSKLAAAGLPMARYNALGLRFAFDY
jgi:phosphate-selective porin OprO/OprP